MKYSLNVIITFIFFGGIFLQGLSQNNSKKLQELSKKADVIVTGKVSKNQANWNRNKTRIYTTTTIEVDEVLKGNESSSTLEIIHPGGEIDGIGEKYTHMPSFKDSEEVFVFLKKDQKSLDYKVLYGEEGKITILNGENGNEKITSMGLKLKTLKSQIKQMLNQQ